MINIYQKGNNGIVVLSRDREGNRILNEYNDFRPYMYIKSDKGEFKSLKGEKLKKLVYTSPSDVGRERDNYSETWESDILYPVRFLIDRIPKIELTPIKKLYIDIETGNIDNWRTDILNPKKPIYSICCHIENKQISFLYAPNFFEFKENVYHYLKESEMLLSFVLFLKKLDTDLLLGWNINNFDMPYLINRCTQLKVPINEIAHDGHSISCKQFESKATKRSEIEIDIHGRYCFDLLRAYKYMKTSGLDSHGLDDVAQLELGHGKSNIHESPEKLWQSGKIKELLEYNMNDVMLTVELDRKLGIVDRFNEMRIESGCRWNELWQTTKLHHIGLLRHAKTFNGGVILPRRKTDIEIKKKIKGGIVHTSIAGLHYGVLVFDFVSLYPSIMRSWNMSPETKYSDGDIFTTSKIRFKSGTIGFIPNYISKILEMRDFYKSKKDEAKKIGDEEAFKKYDDRQNSYKIKANSLYGDFDNAGFLFYDKEISSAITAIGQEANKWITNIVMENGYKPIYGDTDSLFLEMGQLDIDKLIEEGLNIEKSLNESLNDFVKKYGIQKHYLKLSFDKIFETCYFGSNGKEGVKKRYAGYCTWEK